MKKISIIALIISLCCLQVVPIPGVIQAQEVPQFVISWDTKQSTPATSTPIITTPPFIQAPVQTPVVAAEIILPSQITKTTTLSSANDYHGGSNKFQIIRRNFSKPREKSTVSIDQVIKRDTTISNSILTAKVMPPILKQKKPIIAAVPITQNLVTINKSKTINESTQNKSTQVTQFKTIDNTNTPKVIKTPLDSPIKPVVQSVKKTIKRKIQTVPSKKISITKNYTGLIQFSTVPNEFKTTTLSSNTDFKQDLNRYQWIKSAKNIWKTLITILQVIVIATLIGKIYQMFNKKIALQILARSRRQKRQNFVTKKISSNIVPRETFAFDCNKIRTMRPDRPYYHIFPTSSY
jgi:hypothetical protein